MVITVRGRDDFGDSVSEITKRRVDAVFVSHTMTPTARRQLVEFAVKNRLPTMFMSREYGAAGGLMSYGPNRQQYDRRLAIYIDKLLRGAKPGDLPVEQPTTFELLINLKTAKVLGLTMPPSFLQRADQVIE